MSISIRNPKALLSVFNANDFGTYNRTFAKLFGLAEAVLLNEIISKQDFFELTKQVVDIDGETGFFYMTNEQIEERTGMRKDMALAARKRLIEKGIVETKDYGLPRRKYYRLKIEVLMKYLDDAYEDSNNSSSRREPADREEKTRPLAEVNPPTRHYIEEEKQEEKQYEYTEAVASPSPPASASSPSKEKEQIKHSFGELSNVKLTSEEHAKLEERIGKPATALMVDRLDLYLGKTGKRYKSHYATVLSWIYKDKEEKTNNQNSVIAKHRQGSKLAFEKEKDTWQPNYANKRKEP